MLSGRAFFGRTLQGAAGIRMLNLRTRNALRLNSRRDVLNGPIEPALSALSWLLERDDEPEEDG